MTESEGHSPEDRLKTQIEAYHASALAYAAVKLGLPEKMGSGAWTADTLAAEMRLSPPHLHRFLRGLVTLGICEERADRTFALTELGQSLKLASPSRLGEKVAIVVEQYWRPWADLVSTLQTGIPAFDHVFAMPVLEWRRANPDAGALYSTYLAKENFAQASDVLDAIDLRGVRTVAQIAGVLLDAVMLDAIEVDVEHSERVNTSVLRVSVDRPTAGFRPVDVLWLRPSQRVRELAAELADRIPPVVHYLMRGLGSEAAVTELASYLLFDRSFCGQLMELGRLDVAAEREQIAAFFAR